MKKQNWKNYIDWILLGTLLIFSIYAHINGFYINNTIEQVETCNGIPTIEGIEALERLEQKGIITKTETKGITNNKEINNILRKNNITGEIQ